MRVKALLNGCRHAMSAESPTSHVGAWRESMRVERPGFPLARERRKREAIWDIR